MNANKIVLISGLIMATTLTVPGRVNAQNASTCSINSTGVNFGSYNVFNTNPTDSTGAITYRCSRLNGNGNVSVTINLSQGNATTYTPRQMRNGTQVLQYNLFIDAARTSIWGNGTSGTSNYTFSAQQNTNITVNIFGRIPAAQDVSAGIYSDNITATINF